MKDKNNFGANQELRLVISLTRALQSINKKEAPIINSGGLSFAQFGVLEFLYHKGSQTIKNIIAKTLSSGGNMTVVINNLEKLNYIKRISNPSDKRSNLIELTPSGRSVISKLFPIHQKNLEKTLSHLSSKEKEELILLCKKLGKGIV